MRRFLDDSSWYSLGILQIVLFIAWLCGAQIDWWLMLMPIYILAFGFTVSVACLILMLYLVGEDYEDDSNE